MNTTKLLSAKRKTEYGVTPQKTESLGRKIFNFLVLCTPLLLLTHLFHAPDHHGHTAAADAGQLPNVTAEMRTADFWIKQTPDADLVLRNSVEGANWNLLEAGEKGTVIHDLSEFNRSTTQAEITKSLEEDINSIASMKLFDRNRNEMSENDLARLAAAQNSKSVPAAIPIQYGILIRDSNVRLLPTNETFTKEAGDLEFDELQNSRGRAFSVVRVLHTSKDQGWFYVLFSDIHGWVPIDDVALVPNKNAARNFLFPKNFLMVLADSVTVYSDPALKIPFAQVRMGTKLTLISDKNKTGANYTVMIPIKGSGGMVDLATAYVKKSDADVRVGYLPFTRENILREAFRLLSQPYGWGGMWKARDCSSFLQDVFSTMGVTLPRNSASQAASGSYFAKFEMDKSPVPNAVKEAALDQAPPATSLLRLNGHIMLYLGKVNGNYYVIHNSSGYRVPRWFGEDKVYKLNQVVVSDLSLGKGSKKKSLLERLLSINTVD